MMEKYEYGKEVLINEIHIMQDIDHANIIKLHYIYETLTSIYLVLDLVTGG